MKKFIPTVIPIVLAAAFASSGQMQSMLSSHPATSALLSAAYAILAHWLPSPRQS